MTTILNNNNAVLIQERDEFLNRVVWYPRFKTAYDTLVHFMNFGGRDEEALLISAPVGTGKSFLLEQIQRDFPMIETDERSERPVLYIRVPPENTLGGLLSNLLAAMGDPLPTACSIAARRQRLKRLMKAQNTRIIFIDEAQSAVPKSGGHDKSENIKLLRELTDDLHIPIVLTGKEDVVDIFEVDSALRSRVRCTLHLAYFSCKTPEDALDFADYMDVLLGMFPRKLHGFTFITETGEDEIALSSNINNLIRLMLASHGSQRSIKYLLKSVIETSASDEVITTEHFARIFYMANNLEKPLRFNPFDAPFSKVKAEAEKRGLYDHAAF